MIIKIAATRTSGVMMLSQRSRKSRGDFVRHSHPKPRAPSLRYSRWLVRVVNYKSERGLLRRNRHPSARQLSWHSSWSADHNLITQAQKIICSLCIDPSKTPFRKKGNLLLKMIFCCCNSWFLVFICLFSINLKNISVNIMHLYQLGVQLSLNIFQCIWMTQSISIPYHI